MPLLRSLLRSEASWIRLTSWRAEATRRRAQSAFDAYMTFEQVERGVRAKNPALAAELEGSFAELRARASGRQHHRRARFHPAAACTRAGKGRAILGRPPVSGQSVFPVVRDHAPRGAGGNSDRRRAYGVPGEDGCLAPEAGHQSGCRCRHRGQPGHCLCDRDGVSSHPRPSGSARGGDHGGRHGCPLLRELLVALQDGGGQVEPLREEQGE